MSSSSSISGAYILDSASIAARLLRGPSQDAAADAQAEAAGILAEARAQAEVLREAAREDGLREGLSQAAERFQRTLSELEEQRQALDEEYQRICDGLEPDVLKLSLEIASKIITHEIEQTPETVVQVLRLSLRQLKDRGHVRLRVNREDLDCVRAAREDIAEWLDGLRDLEVIEDRRVERGGVIVESADGVLDARPVSQMDEVQKRLTEAA